MAKRKKLKAKELKHDPFRDWYERQAEWVLHHRDQTRRGLVAIGVTLAVAVASSLGYSSWNAMARRQLATAFDIFNASVTDSPQATSPDQRFKTEAEKYRAALAAYRHVSEPWYYRFSNYHEIALYYEGLCQLQLDPPKGQTLLEQLAQGNSIPARLARLALGEYLVSQGHAEEAEALYRKLNKDPGPLPKSQIQLSLARALEAQGKEKEAVDLYLEVAKDRSQQVEGRQAVARLAVVDPAALDQLPDESTSPTPRDALSRYRKK